MSYLRIIMPEPPEPWQLMVVTLVSFGLAVLSWRFVERTFRRPARPPGPTVSRYAVVLVLALVGPIMIKAGRDCLGGCRIRRERSQLRLALGSMAHATLRGAKPSPTCPRIA
jgi:hypothetical protein